MTHVLSDSRERVERPQDRADATVHLTDGTLEGGQVLAPRRVRRANRLVRLRRGWYPAGRRRRCTVGGAPRSRPPDRRGRPGWRGRRVVPPWPALRRRRTRRAARAGSRARGPSHVRSGAAYRLASCCSRRRAAGGRCGVRAGRAASRTARGPGPSRRCCVGTGPVWSDARLGLQCGAVQKLRANRTPSAAKASRAGDVTVACP